LTTPSLSVVLPVLNEERTLPATLESVLCQRPEWIELIVVDGGSTDRTIEIAQELGANCLSAPRAGRGSQIALGMEGIAGDIVLVAHGDMRLSCGACARIRRHMAEHPECPGGSLGHRFDSNRAIYRLIEWFDARRARRGMSYGDQAQFFRSRWISHSGGFPQSPIMEDVELSQRLLRLGRPAYLDDPVIVSPRRFESQGILRTAWWNWRLRCEHRSLCDHRPQECDAWGGSSSPSR
jgi:rSAM/selenodomain-associated transferase 2